MNDASHASPAQAPQEPLAAHALQVQLGGRTVLHGVDVALRPGWTAIVGPNGAGKSTLLKALGGLLPAAAGQVLLAGRPLSSWPAAQRARQLAWLPQGGGATGELTVRETVALGRLAHLGLTGVAGPADHRAVDEALQATDGLAWQHNRLTALSGGERQRVFLARALATEAPVLLLDEPTTHLDPPHQVALAELLQRLTHPDAGGPPARRVLTVLHDLPIALLADQLWVMQAGRVIACGPIDDPLVRQSLEAAFGGAVSILPAPDRACGWRVELALGRRPANGAPAV